MILSILGLFACNQYELFVVRDDRGVRSNDADLLFVIDNSDSMSDESVALAENFAAFVAQLVATDAATSRDGLGDAVTNYVDASRDPGGFVDFQLAITTIDARDTTGALVGDPAVLRKGDDGLILSFLSNLMCEATCFADRRVVDSNPDVRCNAAWDGEVTAEFLDCLCGVDAWIGHCGGGTEEGLEAVYGAMCRAVPEPPATCFEDTTLTAAETGSNAGMLREGATFVPVIVTDEGDASHRMQNVDPVPLKYYDLVNELGVDTAWAVIGPGLTDTLEVACPGAQSWGALRYDYLTQYTGGVKLDIHGPGCGPADFAVALQQVGNLVGGGIRAYRLPSPPVVESIVVELDGVPLDRAEPRGEDLFGQVLYADGWTYEDESQTVLLRGNVIPGPEDEVRIWYWPAR